MKSLFRVILMAVVALLASTLHAQVTNLRVNGSDTSFSIVSGDMIAWEFNLPAGDTAWCQIWLDVNQNRVIEQATDRLYLWFGQVDGDFGEGLDGPPDLDGIANGHIGFMSRVGIAPGTFIMRFESNGTGMQVPGRFTPLASPAYTVSGKVIVPAGQSAQNVLVELNTGEQSDVPFWHALTDGNGDYFIQTDADTTGSPWYLSVSSSSFPGGAVVSPGDTLVRIAANPSGVNFRVEFAAAKVNGIVVDEAGQPLPKWQIYLHRDDLQVYRSFDADPFGYYEAGILSGELNGQPWVIQAGDGNPFSTTAMMAQRVLPVIHAGDSLYRRLVVYTINSQIQGQVRVNGGAPGFAVSVVAWNLDTAQVATQTDGAGNFTIGVSNLIYNYQLFPIDLGPGYAVSNVTAHPGDTGVIINVSLTSVGEADQELPGTFTLKQNYPNPFNPSTTISYGVPHRSHVRLSVYNALGQMVARLVDGVEEAGYHQVQFGGSAFASGVYFYRLQADGAALTMKLVLVR